MTSKATNDATFQMVLNLMHELWVVKDRAALLEKVLDDAGISVAEKVDLLQPDEALEAALEKERKAFIARVLAPTLEAESS
ncbi:MAG: hypothetical protein AB8B96_02105 [Lysobacterales bacterium]